MEEKAIRSNIKYYKVDKNNPIEVKLETSNKKSLFHYTTKNGIKGILGSSSFFISHSSYLDDTLEIKYISIVLDGVIRYLKENKNLYDLRIKGQYEIYDAIIKVLEAQRDIYKSGSPILDGSLYLLSLTENKDNKYLIDNYCKGEGSIIEIKNDFKNMFSKNKDLSVMTSAKVVYDLDEQMTRIIKDINEFYTELLHSLVKEKSVNYLELVDTIKFVICFKLINYSLYFKHQKYSKEEEYRVVFLVEDNSENNIIKHRMVKNRMTPYIVAKINDGYMFDINNK